MPPLPHDRRCRGAQAPRHRLRIELTTGDVVERDLGALLWGPVFEPLLGDARLFAAAFVEAGTVAWPGGADIDPDTLIWGGPVPADLSARPPRFLRVPSGLPV